MKQERGITLIALVITIIVLLILAGVSIAMLTGENGLLNRSKSAVIESKIAECKEHVMLTVNELISEYYELKYVGPESTRPTQNTPEAYVAAKISSKLDSKYASASGATITLTEKNPNSPDDFITGTYDSTSTDEKLGTITWSYTGRTTTGTTNTTNTTP